MSTELKAGVPQMLRRWTFLPAERSAFLAAVICGLLAHGMALFNKLSWHDDLYYLFDVGATVSSGRWTLHLLYWLENLFYQDGHFSLPLFNGIIAIACIGAAAGLLIRLLGIRSKTLSALLGALMVSFPVMTGLFTYVFTIHYYMIAMLGMTVSGLLLCRGRRLWHRALAIPVGAAAMGIYQAFLPMTLGIILLDGIKSISEGKKSPGAFWKEKGIQALCLAGMMLLYFAANRLLQRRLGLGSEITYPGMEGMSSASPLDYLGRIGRAYREFFLPERRTDWDMYPLRVYTLYQVMLAGDVLLSLLLVIRTARKGWAEAVYLMLLLGLVPLGFNFIFVMADHVHGLMTYAQTLQFALLIWLLKEADFRRIGMRRAASAAAAVVLGMTGALYVRLANQCYLKIQLEQQEAISFFTTLITQIKSSEDYCADRPVLFLNELEIADPTVTHIRELDSIRTLSYEFNTLEYLNQYTWARFMEIWCGFTPVYYEGPDLSGLPEVQRMPHYPDAGSVQVVGDVLVVNF